MDMECSTLVSPQTWTIISHDVCGDTAMIRFRRISLDVDVLPHAIFWRPVRYFATYIRTDEDGLDAYSVASFDLGNELQFDLRTYQGHPQSTVSLYLASDYPERRLQTAIRAVVQGLVVPINAIAWRRGQDFQYGELPRSTADRLREPEARLLALKIAARRQDRTATTEYIKKEIPKVYPLSEADMQPSQTRGREHLWQQIVGNVISHKSSPTGLFRRGLAVLTDDGLTVTDDGMAYLNSIGFSV